MFQKCFGAFRERFRGVSECFGASRSMSETIQSVSDGLRSGPDGFWRRLRGVLEEFNILIKSNFHRPAAWPVAPPQTGQPAGWPDGENYPASYF